MEHATYTSRLRYLDADDVDDSAVDFGDLEVRGREDAKLGDIDGFIVDADSGRVYYVVVDSGGWFTSRRFLLPVGHATVDREAGAVRVDVGQEALRRYPEFDEDRFRAFSDDDLRAFERRTLEACCPDEVGDVSAGTWRYYAQRHYAQPAWWGADLYARERLRPVERGVYATAPSRQAHDRELVTARERDTRERDTYEERGEPSPHFEGRAQPGDVLGLETGGERTYIGDSAEDENRRRRGSERTVREDTDRKR